MIAQHAINADWLVGILTGWVKAFPMIGTLLLLMGFDFVSGTMVSLIRHTFSSPLSFRGMTKKAFMVMVVGVAQVIDMRISAVANSPLGIAHVVALFYCWTEVVSITENAAKLGVPIPPILLEKLAALKGEKKPPADKKPPTDKQPPTP